MGWPRFFRAVEVLWESMWSSDLSDIEPVARAASLRRVRLKSVMDKAETSALDFSLGDLAAHHGEQHIPIAIERIRALLDTCDRLAAPAAL
jgi:hypothetical protein